jgi:hypothetical protein
MNISDLDNILTKCLDRARDLDPKMRGEAIQGHCDAFAIALIDTLAKHYPDTPTSVVVISRERRSKRKSGRLFDTNPFSHAIVDVGGIMVDVDGTDADTTWEDEWIQPQRNDEAEPSEDFFDYHSMTVEGLTALRLERDNRNPCPTMRARFAKCLDKAMTQVKNEAAPKARAAAKLGR